MILQCMKPPLRWMTPVRSQIYIPKIQIGQGSRRCCYSNNSYKYTTTTTTTTTKSSSSSPRCYRTISSSIFGIVSLPSHHKTISRCSIATIRNAVRNNNNNNNNNMYRGGTYYLLYPTTTKPFPRSLYVRATTNGTKVTICRTYTCTGTMMTTMIRPHHVLMSSYRNRIMSRNKSSNSNNSISTNHNKSILNSKHQELDILTTTTTIVTNPYHHIGNYLLFVSGMVIAMISIGGITRLTQSGLSMTSWKLTGTLPPITYEQWVHEFHIYQQYPEYQQRQSMTLSEFQYIYFWEYGHRMMGRLIGIVYVLPYLYFTITKQIPKGYHPRFILIGSIGLLQGYVGWWMVQSGLTQDRFHDTNEIRVKPLRLATHLGMAITTYSLLLYTALDMYRHPFIQATTSTGSTTIVTPLNHQQLYMKDILRTLSRSSIGMIGLTLITILSGALVAGNDAGRAYNTFPKMNDEWFPSDYFGVVRHDGSIPDDIVDRADTHLSRETTALLATNHNIVMILKNFYENTATVQFNHRFGGIATAISGLSLSLYGLHRMNPSLVSSIISSSNSSSITTNTKTKVIPTVLLPYVRTGLLAIGIAVTGQFTLGVTTLLTYVPIPLAALHQIGSLVVLTSSIYLFHTTRTIVKALPTVTKTIATTTPTTAATTTHPVLTNPILLRQLSTVSSPSIRYIKKSLSP